MFMQAIKSGHGCLSSSTKSLVCAGNRNNPESANKRRTPRCMCVCAREIKGGYECVSVWHFLSPVDSYLCMCVCMYMYVKNTE